MITSNNRLCIDIGNNKIKLTEAAVSKSGLVLKKAAILETPENSYNEGDIKNIIGISEVIDRGLRDNKMKCKNAVFTANGTNIITREIVIPQTKEKNIKGIVRGEMEQYLPLSYESYVLEYINLGKVMEGLKIRVVVFPKDVAKNYYDLCNNLKLKPQALDIHSNGIAKAVKRIQEINGQDVKGRKIVLVDLGDHSITFNGFDGEEQRFSRVIESDFEEAKKHYMDHKGMTSEDFIEVLETLDVSEGEGREYEEEFTVVYDAVAQWARDVERIYSYYTNNLKEEVEAFYVYGGGSRIKGVVELLGRFIGVEVQRLDNIKFKGDKKVTENAGMFMNNIGASFRDGR